jgi:aminotransferase
MTGLRLAYATGPDSIIRALTVIQQYTVVCAPAPVQWAGITALDVDMSSYIDSYRKNRDYCLQALSGRVPFSRPAGAFYIFPEVPGGDQAFTDRAVAEKKLILVPGSIFSASRKNVRISFATTPENLKRGMDAFLELI